MEIDDFIARLSANAAVFENLLTDVDPAAMRWKPAPEAWSLLEIVNHLYDEERDDFRCRLEMTLRDPAQAWPKIDPPGWAVERRYNERDPAESLENFLSERQVSLTWLAGLGPVDWDITHQHPVIGPLRAGDLMASWLAHDLLHIRQMTQRHFQRLAATSAPYTTRYAGEW
jgi:hypothetical protein